MRVLKFGGTSVADADAIRRAIDIVARERGARVVVVSALAGVTDTLIELAATACTNLPAAGKGLESLAARHHAVAEHVSPARRRHLVTAGVDGIARSAQRTLAAIAAAAAPRPSAALLDRLVAAGELWSSRLVAAMMETAALAVRWVDAREVLRTDAVHQAATADLDATTRAVERLVRPALAFDRIVVVGGFVGSGPDGTTTTLGRGGSDYSAAVLGACLSADEIQIWTDVDGVLTADPRVIAHARPVERLSYAEAHDLATFGAKVLHPATMQPAALRNIVVRVLNSRRPEARGTLIGPQLESWPESGLTAVACRHRIMLVDVVLRDARSGEPFAAAIFRELAARGAPVVLADLCGNRLALAVDDSADVSGFAESVAPYATVRLHHGLAAVCAVGRAWPPAPRLLRDALALLGDTPVHMVARPSAISPFAVVVDAEHAAAVMTWLHDGFFYESTEACA